MEGTVEDLLEDMQAMFIEVKGKNIHTSFLKATESATELAESSQEAAKGLYKFANEKMKQKILKIFSVDVPKGILPQKYSATLHDIKVDGHCPDDEVYSKNLDILQQIPRGTTLLELTREDEESHLDSVIYANRKFTGHFGDEDEAQPESNNPWQHYFLEDPDSACEAICMKKINGEAAHFSGRYIGGQFYLITGSKNVHMVIRDSSDLDSYSGDRYAVAKIVARCVLDTLDKQEEEQCNLLQKFLHHTKCTAVCEILQPDHQHIVDLSHLKRPLLNVISFTPPVSGKEATSLVAMPPHHTLDFLSMLGFTCPSYDRICAKKVPEHIKKVRGGFSEEGEVLYYLNEVEETIGLVKIKTLWYIMLRALREKVVFCFTTSKKRQDWDIEEHIKSTVNRFTQIQKWLQFPGSFLKEWEKLGEDFIRWMQGKIERGSVVAEKIRPQYPSFWKEFLSEEGRTDQISP